MLSVSCRFSSLFCVSFLRLRVCMCLYGCMCYIGVCMHCACGVVMLTTASARFSCFVFVIRVCTKIQNAQHKYKY